MMFFQRILISDYLVVATRIFGIVKLENEIWQFADAVDDPSERSGNFEDSYSLLIPQFDWMHLCGVA